MGFHSALIRFLQARQSSARLRRRGPLGDFHRAGGESLLHDILAGSEDVVIDAGGYSGDWMAAILVRYGCRGELLEPVPEFAKGCSDRFSGNARVRVLRAALGGSVRTARFSMDHLASSEFAGDRCRSIEASVLDVHELVSSLAEEFGEVACLKLNIEGGEYEVLERLLDVGSIVRCRSLLVQFHRQPDGWADRLGRIGERLLDTHRPEWQFPMIWEKWVRRDVQTRSPSPTPPPRPA